MFLATSQGVSGEEPGTKSLLGSAGQSVEVAGRYTLTFVSDASAATVLPRAQVQWVLPSQAHPVQSVVDSLKLLSRGLRRVRGLSR